MIWRHGKMAAKWRQNSFLETRRFVALGCSLNTNSFSMEFRDFPPAGGALRQLRWQLRRMLDFQVSALHSHSGAMHLRAVHLARCNRSLRYWYHIVRSSAYFYANGNLILLRACYY